MIDGLKVFFWTKMDWLKQHLPKLILRVSEETGEVICHETTYRGIYVHLYEGSSLGVKLHGSIHKFFSGGNNDSLFTYEDVCHAVKDFAETFGVNLSRPCIQSLEVGINIPVENPEKIIDAAILYHGCVASSYDRNGDGSFKEWTFNDYTVKLYTKGSSILRYEFHYHRMRKLKGVQIFSLADLVDRSKFVACLFNLYYFSKEFLFVPVASAALPGELGVKWANWRNDNYWRTLDRSRKSREKAKVNMAIASYDMDDWRFFLENAVLEQGALMLGTSVKELDATFSTFGLSAETVADPPGDCDRPTVAISDAYPSKPVVSICLIQSVRNEGLGHVPTMVRLYSDVHLGGRGPPGALNASTKLRYLIET